MNRREFLAGLSASTALLAVPATVNAAASVKSRPFDQQLISGLAETSAINRAAAPTQMSLRNLNTDEILKLKIHAGNLVDRTSLMELSNFLRDHHNDTTHQIDPSVIRFLTQIWRDVGDEGEVEIASGYRSPETNQQLLLASGNAAEGSLHMNGQALDFKINGVPLTQIRDHAFTCQGGGVGFYPNSSFLHIDSGRPRFWGWWPSNWRDVVGYKLKKDIA